MIKKKEGASLIVVIIIFMFVASVSIGMLSMIGANYKARVSESNRIENLYSSESGLDVAYNIMIKTFDAGTTYGYYEVEALKKGIQNNDKNPNIKKYADLKSDISNLNSKIEAAQAAIKSARDSDDKAEIKTQNNNIQKYNGLIDEDNQMIEILLNEEFKRAFKYFINDSQSPIDHTITPNQLKNSITNKTYVNNVTGINGFDTVNVNIQNTTEQLDEHGAKETFPKLSAEEVNLVNATTTSKTVKHEEGNNKPVTIDITKNDKYEISLQSIFQSTKQKTNTESVGNNLRTVQAKYNIFVPEYSDIFFGKGTDNISQYVVVENKALMVGKEMIINGTNNLNVTGNVFVEGKSDTSKSIDSSNRTYEKYNGGIKINYENGSIKSDSDSDNVVFNNDVITRGTFNLQDSMKVKIAGNLYANNFYAGGEKLTELDRISSGSRLNANTFILDNDLTVKGNDTHIGMSEFYGINDKNTNKSDGGTNRYYNTTHVADNVGKERTSSSIIVNSPDANSTIDISNEAYIMGVAHINTDNGYQTGESVAVKGNYSAYSVPLDSQEKFIFDNPLQVLDESNVFNKAKHFSDYWNKTSNGDIGKNLDRSGQKANNGGISLPTSIYSTGAIVYKDGDQTIVKPSQYTLDVETKVNNMRIDYATQVYRIGAQSDIADYDNLGKHADSVEDLIDLTPDILQNSSYSASTELGVNKKEVAVFSMNSIEIDGNKITVDGHQYTIGSTINAVIVTKGDVNIKGTVNFNGNIITCGNLNVGSGNITIKYDEEIINRIKLKNSTLFKNVFKNMATKEAPASTSNKEVSLNDIKSQYDIGKFLQNKLWRIVENIK